MQLEERINQYLDKNSETPYRVKVTNFARGGSSSPFQFEMLKAAFPEEGPDVIISMLGINDSNLMAVDHYSLYKMSYLTRFLYWSYIAYKCPNCYRDGIRDTTGHGTAINQKETYAINDTNHLQNTFSQAVDSALAGPDPEKQLEQAFISYKEKFAALRARHPEATHMVGGEAGNRLFALSQKPAFHKKFQTFRSDILSYGEQLFEEFKDTAVFVHPAYLQHACHIKWALRKADCSALLKEGFIRGVPITYQILTPLSHNPNSHKDPFLQALFRHAGFELRGDSKDSSITSESYRNIGNFSAEKNSTWFAMQYPTGSLEGIRQYFRHPNALPPRSFTYGFYMEDYDEDVLEEYRDVILVSNANFNEAVAAEGVETYFTDLFTQDHGLRFGHTTEKGHSLIAENLMKEFLLNWKTIEKRKDQRSQTVEKAAHYDSSP